MIIDLKQIFELGSKPIEIDYSISLLEYELFGYCPFTSPVVVKGSIQNKAGIVELKADLGFNMSLICDRCIEQYSSDFNWNIEHILVVSLNTDNDEYIVVKDYKLDLDELVLSDILLNLPTKLLCNENCKGLCQKCGKNRNIADCDCKNDLPDPRFSVLNELLK